MSDKKAGDFTPIGPEIGIAQTGVPCGLFQKRMEPGYRLTDGTVLLDSERDALGRYLGGAGMDGMYLKTGQVYIPVLSKNGTIQAFQEVKPENYLAAAEMSTEANYNQIDGIINGEVSKTSVLDALKKCQQDAGKSDNQDIPFKPRHEPER